MPLVDITSVTGGYNQAITDWPLGDDRQFLGDTQLSVSPPPAGDLALSDAYFTMKLNPNDIDANAIIQKHVTPAGGLSGQILAGLNGALTSLQIKVFSGDYEPLVNAETVYYWDIRCITSVGGVTFTVAIGTVSFLQNVTQTNKAGTPATLPNDGQPQFRGFNSNTPMLLNPGGIFNVGDFMFNSNPSNGNGIGWQCSIGGSPGTWVSMGQVVQTINDIHFKGYANSEPISTVGFVVPDYFLNNLQAPGQPEGWVLTANGWRTKGIVGDT